MTRWLLLALVLANAAVFAWLQGWMMPLAVPPWAAERESARLAAQVRPGDVKLLTPAAVEALRRSAANAPANPEPPR